MSGSLGIKKVVLAAGAGLISLAILGGAALAAFAPIASQPPSGSVAGLEAVVGTNKGGDRLETILDALVARGVITRAQADAIVAAVRDAQPKRDGLEVKRVFANLFEESAKYLNLSVGDLKAKVQGTSLGAVAGTIGKSRTGLVAHLQSAANTAIDNALAAGKITREQADKAKADAPATIARFVDHVYTQTPPRTKQTTPQTKTTARELKVSQFLGDAVATASSYLGLSQRDLATALRQGKSLGEIASTTTGKSKDGLIGAVAAAVNAKIDKATADGKLTAEGATALKAQVGEAVKTLIDRSGTGATLFKR